MSTPAFDPPTHQRRSADPRRLGLLAFGLSASWIVASDLVLDAVIGDSSWVGWSIVKGAAYSVVLGLMIAAAARRWEDRRIRHADEAAEHATARAREVMRGVVDTLTDGLFVVDAGGHISYANPAVGTIIGADPDRIIGMHIAAVGELLDDAGETIPVGARPGAMALRDGVSTVGRPATLVRRDGERRELTIDAAPLPFATPDGATEVVVVFADVTELHATRRGERAAKAQLDSVVARMPDVFALVDITGRIRYASPAVAEVVGENPANLMGRTFDDFIHDADLEAIRTVFIAAVAGDLDDRPREMRIVRRDGGQRHVEYTLASLLDVPEVEAFAVFVRDVTERKAMERERAIYAANLERTNTDLKRAAAARDELLAVASHELRTPLTPIKGFVALLRARSADHLSDVDLTMLDTIERNTDKLIRRVDDLLLSTGLRTGATTPRREHVPLHEIVRAVATSVEAESATRVDLDLADDLVVEADPEHLRQIVLNLLSNAVVYGRPPVLVRTWRDGVSTLLCVTDHGDGVPASFVPRMWDRFSQATTGDRRTSMGLGMGLYLVRRLARINGLAVAYEQAPGTGASFTLTFPTDAGRGGAPSPDVSGGLLLAMRARPGPELDVDGEALATLIRGVLRTGDAVIVNEDASCTVVLADTDEDGLQRARARIQDLGVVFEPRPAT